MDWLRAILRSWSTFLALRRIGLVDWRELQLYPSLPICCCDWADFEYIRVDYYILWIQNPASQLTNVFENSLVSSSDISMLAVSTTDSASGLHLRALISPAKSAQDSTKSALLRKILSAVDPDSIIPIFLSNLSFDCDFTGRYGYVWIRNNNIILISIH